MFIAGLFTLWLALGPPNSARDQALAELEQAITSLGDVPPWQSIELLEHSIAGAVQGGPRALLDDPRLRDQLYQARVALVWAHLANHDQASATAAMDEVIRSSGGKVVSRGFGPDVESLYATRLSMANAADQVQFVVECKVPCEVLVNERRSGDLTGTHETLSVGIYRVWVVGPDGVEPSYREVVLHSDGEPVKVLFGVQQVIEDERPTSQAPASALKEIRKMKIGGGILVGLAALSIPVMGAGISLLVDPPCSRQGCTDYLGRGGALMLVGAIVMVSSLIPGSVLLADGMKKQRRLRMQFGLPSLNYSPRTIRVGWSLRF